MERSRYDTVKAELLAKGYTLTRVGRVSAEEIRQRDGASYEDGIGDDWAKPGSVLGRRKRTAQRWEDES